MSDLRDLLRQQITQVLSIRALWGKYMELIIEGLTKRYGGITALDEVSLTICDGVYALLGPNGAGKSTLINILTGNLKQDSGRILFNGIDITKRMDKYLSCIGYVPQQQAMYVDFRVSYYLGYMAALKGVSGALVPGEIKRVLNMVGLLDRRNSRISNLSGGMRQRLLIAQSLLGDPKVLIFDEPTTGLDPEQRIKFKQLVSEIAEGKIVLLATHIVDDIEYISNKIILINNGRVLRCDSRDELVKELEGKIFETDISSDEFEGLSERVDIIDYLRDGERIHVRFFSEDEDAPGIYSKRTAGLEDVYYSFYGLGD